MPARTTPRNPRPRPPRKRKRKIDRIPGPLKITAKPIMPAQPKATLEKILQLLSFDAAVEEHPLDEGFLLDVKTEDSGRLIGRQGQTLSDLQYITNRLLSNRTPPARR